MSEESLLETHQPSQHGRDAEADLATIAALGVGIASGEKRSPGDSLKSRLLASMGRGKYGRYADKLARLLDVDVAFAEKVLANVEDPAAWNAFFVPGIEMMMIESNRPNTLAVIAKIQPGARMPEHVHRGEEVMFLLDGGFKEEKGDREVWRGDELVSTDGTDHSFIALPGVPCIAFSLIEGIADFG